MFAFLARLVHTTCRKAWKVNLGPLLTTPHPGRCFLVHRFPGWRPFPAPLFSSF